MASHNRVVRPVSSISRATLMKTLSLWGTVTTLSGLVQNFGGVLAIRLVLGACEGGLLPGMVRNPFYPSSRSNHDAVFQ